MSSLKKINKIELEENKADTSLWTVVNGKVYDLTTFFETHPGGPEIIQKHAGKDATQAFNDANHPASAKKEMEKFCIGEFAPSKLFKKLEEISDHNTANDLWLLIHNKVYDVSTFKHPGKYIPLQQ
jgi:cytochrome b involved in lipid metabolism